MKALEANMRKYISKRQYDADLGKIIGKIKKEKNMRNKIKEVLKQSYSFTRFAQSNQEEEEKLRERRNQLKEMRRGRNN